MTFKKIKKEDTVKVIAGKDVGKTGKVLSVDREKGKVLVEGVNIVKKTVKKTSEKQAGGIKDIEAYLDISNVMLICPKCKKDTRVGFVINGDEKKRICKKCKAEID
jgi:large subunit ribosomal protein L24